MSYPLPQREVVGEVVAQNALQEALVLKDALEPRLLKAVRQTGLPGTHRLRPRKGPQKRVVPRAQLCTQNRLPLARTGVLSASLGENVKKAAGPKRAECPRPDPGANQLLDQPLE